MNMWKQDPSSQSTRWIAREFSELVAERAEAGAASADPTFDVLIVGSGYGGAIAAAELAGCRQDGRAITVGVLERGREYLPGAFPARMADLPAHVRGNFAGHRRGGEGLFDIRAGGDVSVVLANGLGGGSLINAGVMEIPKAAVFADPRWQDLGWDQDSAYYARAKELLGASINGGDNSIAAHAHAPLKKTNVLRELATGSTACPSPKRFRHAALTVAMQDKVTVGGVKLSACTLCGDCATGCNYGAKESLDTNLLVQAFRRGARIYCGATVLRLERPADKTDLWRIQVTHTDEKLRLREGPPLWITARKVILAAGALGSSEILLRSQRESSGLAFSKALGKRFSTNGDLISFGFDYEREANAIADENMLPGERQVGPTITGIIDTEVATGPECEGRQPIVIEELAVPGALRRAAEESLTTANTLHALGEFDGTSHRTGRPDNDPYAVDEARTRRTSIFAAMGDDGAAGVLELAQSERPHDGDGHLRVVWPEARKLPIFDAQHRHIEELARSTGCGGRTIPNPLWRFLPPSMESLIGGQRGPLVTVHPLGGCPMGRSAADAVVNRYGQVFDTAAAAGFHEGLIVLDGAIVPTALSTNPALTIAALALRAVEHLRRNEWQWTRPDTESRLSVARPAVADTAAEIAQRRKDPRKTVAEFTERLSGPVRLRDERGQAGDYWVEITLTYDPLPLQNLFTPDAAGRLEGAKLELSPGQDAAGRPKGLLRIFRQRDWEDLQQQDLQGDERLRKEQAASRSYALSGSLTILRREATNPVWRTLRALWAWLQNRGIRDIVQDLIRRCSDRRKGYLPSGSGVLKSVIGALKLASRAGEVRLFEYALKIGEELAQGHGPDWTLLGDEIHGRKRITYGRPSNPWRQLQELSLTRFPGLGRFARPRVLALDPRYLVARNRPLFKIAAQRDHLEALVDAASLGAYFLRMMLSIHIWNARKPDLPRPRRIKRLPGRLPGLPEPEIHELQVDQLNGKPVRLRLTRYRLSAPAPDGAPPVVMIHGYSAGGTTFAHPTLQPSLAQHLAQAGRDVWVADLRTSCGMPTATHPWTFERVALADIPAAIDYVCWNSNRPQVDVIAHCMGAAMFSMAILSADRTELADQVFSSRDDGVRDRFRAQRRALPERIRRAVLSQVGPVLVMSQPNIFRAYVTSFVEQVFGPLSYTFRPEPDQGLAAELMDRLLSSLPYPDEELIRENPCQPWRRTDHLGTRHRMDALYGRTFSLGNMSRATLDRIDDFFGPMSLDTVSQVIHFALHQTITNRDGRNRFVTRESLMKHWTFPTLSIHGQDNGLADVATLHRMRRVMQDAGREFEGRVFPGYGHQDCLMGANPAPIFQTIQEYLDRPQTRPAPAVPADEYIVQAPWLGPMLSRDRAGALHVGIGASPQLGAPRAVCFLPVRQRPDQRWLADDSLHPQDTIRRLPLDKGTDWFFERLPDWAQGAPVGHVAVLLIYARPVDGEALETQDAVWKAVHAAVAAMESTAAPEVMDLSDAAIAAGGRLDLALGSCQYPPGILDQELAYESWARLNQRLDQAAAARPVRPELMILTGDQVYTDPTAGLFDPTKGDDRYRKPYEKWLRNAQVRNAVRRLPVATMLDDHELDDNWEPIAESGEPAAVERNQAYLAQGVSSFLTYQRCTPHNPLWFDFKSQAGIPIFMLDSRTQRSGRAAARAPADMFMFSPRQGEALEQWLRAPAHAQLPKLIVTPGLLLPRHRRAAPAALAFGASDNGNRAALRSDAWDGYLENYYRLLGFIADHDIRGVVFLSGDEHLGLFTTAKINSAHTGKRVTIHSIHCPGLYTPYGFANARQSDLALAETLSFGNGSEYRCEINTEVFPGPGFAHVSVHKAQNANGWNLDCEFDCDPSIRTASQTISVRLDC